MNKILFIDTNRILSEKLSSYLLPEGVVIEQSESSDDYMSRIIRGTYSLLMLSTKFCNEWVSEILNIRKSSNIPIIVLDDNRNIYDEITAYRIGADDYISKNKNLLHEKLMRFFISYGAAVFKNALEYYSDRPSATIDTFCIV